MPVAEASADRTTDLQNAINSIPDPDTVPKSAKPAPTFAPEDAPDPGEPPDAPDNDPDDTSAPAA
jgi:hypothetical protein